MMVQNRGDPHLTALIIPTQRRNNEEADDGRRDATKGEVTRASAHRKLMGCRQLQPRNHRNLLERPKPNSRLRLHIVHQAVKRRQA